MLVKKKLSKKPLRLRTLTIVEKKWLHGGRTLPSKLRDQRQNMCCLGFLALDCGAKPNEIASKLGPSETLEVPWPKKVAADTRDANSAWTDQAMEINDELGAEMSERKSKLALHFRKINYRLKFV